MFYLKEVTFRIQYLSLSFFLTASLCYYNKDLLLFLLTFNALASSSKTRLCGFGVDYFIYTHPSELLTTYLLIVIYFTFIILFYQLLWHGLDFLKSSLSKSHFNQLSITIKKASIGLFSLNTLFLLLLFPNCWTFFESFNNSSSADTTLKFFLELKVKDYVSFLRAFLYTSNIGLSLTLVLHLFLNYQSLKSLLKWKKLIIFLNIFFATLFGPSDSFSQLFDVALLSFFFEVTLFLSILDFKSKKYLTLLG